MQRHDRIDANDSPINATSPELDALHRDLAEVESKIQRLNACKQVDAVMFALAFFHIKRDALLAQIKVWNESELDLLW